jgi:hypothetical protein
MLICFIVKSREFGGLLNLVGNDANKIKAIALLIALVPSDPPTSPQSWLSQETDSANEQGNQACSKAAAQSSSVPNQRINSNEITLCQSKMPLCVRVNQRMCC